MENSSLMTINCSGGLFLARSTKRFLFVQRTHIKTVGTWGLVGGKSEGNDKSPIDTLNREIAEEVGIHPKIDKIIPIDHYSSFDKQFKYGTYIIIVADEFIPILNNEHSSYAWCKYGHWPKPLHNGVKNTINSRIIKKKLELILELI